MPVDFTPLIVSVVLIGVPLLFLFKSRKAFLRTAALSASIVAVPFLWVYVPGWISMAKAYCGDSAAMYEMARWTENHNEQMQSVVFWPFSPDVLGGYAWLEKAAAENYPPAVYAMGVRLKYGQHVPRPPDWDGPGGNVFPQPERGQGLIDKAIGLGYQPRIEEDYFYWRQYRRW